MAKSKVGKALAARYPSGRLKVANRDYHREDASKRTPEHRAIDRSRHNNRNKLVREGKVKKGDGKVVHHANNKSTDHRRGNLKIITRKKHDRLHSNS